MLRRRYKINVKLIDGRSYNWIGIASTVDGQLVVTETLPNIVVIGTATICEHRYNFDHIHSYVAEPYTEDSK